MKSTAPEKDGSAMMERRDNKIENHTKKISGGNRKGSEKIKRNGVSCIEVSDDKGIEITLTNF